MRRRRPVSTTPPLAPRELRGFRVQDWIDPSEPATTEDGGPMIRAYMRHRAAQDAWANEHGCHPQYPNGYGPTALRPVIHTKKKGDAG